MYKVIIKKELQKRMEKNPSYSMRAFAKSLKIDVSTLSRILSAQKCISVPMALKLATALGLSSNEHQEFLEAVIKTQQARSLQKISPKFHLPQVNFAKAYEMDLEISKVISEWYYYAILELTYVKDFQADPKWISRQLGISVMQAKLAVENLLQLGLLEKSEQQMRKTHRQLTTSDKHLTTAALKHRQKQWLEKSMESLENDDIEVRSHTSMTMAIDPTKISEAKRMISEFNRKLCEFLETGNRTQVYELGVSLFPLQKNKKNN